MRILWFSNTPSLYDQKNHHYNGGGWIESLEQLVNKSKGIELAVSFFHPRDSQKVNDGSTTYYPIYRPLGRRYPLRQLIKNWQGTLPELSYSDQLRSVIDDFKPDLIQVFGSDGSFGEVQNLTKTPVVIHLQGLMNPCLNTYFPSGCSGLEFLTSRKYFVRTLKGGSPWHSRRVFARQAAIEEKILRNSRFVMGRTKWDAMIARLYNPSVHYYHIDEVLRPVFYQRNKEKTVDEAALRVFSTLSPTVYKGLDVVLRSAQHLKDLTSIRFTWTIAGLDASDPLLRHFEKKEGIRHQDVGVCCIGKQSAYEIASLLSTADVFVHPSYIDNSPNSVCEAQIIGVPVIACDVGGLSSLVEHEQTGILVPSNGVFELVHHVRELATNPERRVALAERAKTAAQLRHNKDIISQRLIAAYESIVGSR